MHRRGERLSRLGFLGKLAGVALGGASWSALLLLAAQIAAMPRSLSSVLGSAAVHALLAAVALLYIAGASLYSYVVYGLMDEWNRMHGEFAETLRSLREEFRRRGVRGHLLVEMARLETDILYDRVDPLIWGFLGLPPIASILTLYGLWSLVSMNSANLAKEEEACRRMAEIYGEKPPSTPDPMTGKETVLASILVFPLSVLLARIALDLERHASYHEAVASWLSIIGRGIASARTSRDAWLITIGNEILNGRTVNTNAAWLGRKLTFLGFRVRRSIACLDDIDEIVETIRYALSRRPRVIITTGGLGPTFDDKTSEALAKALGREWVVNEDAKKMVEEKYLKAGYQLTPNRLKLAKMPKGAKPIPNPVGTAPGILVEHEGTLIASLPGVPKEMKAIFEEYLEPILRERGPRVAFVEKEIRIAGVPESEAAPIVEKIMKMDPRLYIKSHPSGGELAEPVLTFQVMASAEDQSEAERIVEEAVRRLEEELSRIGGRAEEARGEG